MFWSEKDFKRKHLKLDMFLEELVMLKSRCKHDMDAEFRLRQLIVYHQQHCQNANCHCKTTPSVKLVKEAELLKLIDSIFNWALNHKVVTDDQDTCEHITLKFIT